MASTQPTLPSRALLEAKNPMEKHRFFTVEQRGEAIVAEIVESHLQGETMAEFLKLELLQIVEKNSPQVVIISFRNVKIVSTSIVSFLLFVNKRFSGMGIPLKLGGMSESLRHIFQTLRLDGSVFKILYQMLMAWKRSTWVPPYIFNSH